MNVASKSEISDEDYLEGQIFALTSAITYAILRIGNVEGDANTRMFQTCRGIVQKRFGDMNTDGRDHIAGYERIAGIIDDMMQENRTRVFELIKRLELRISLIETMYQKAMVTVCTTQQLNELYRLLSREYDSIKASALTGHQKEELGQMIQETLLEFRETRRIEGR